MSDRARRLVALLRERSFERKKVILASGSESDFFIDCKQTILTAEGHALVGELMFEALDAAPAVRGGRRRRARRLPSRERRLAGELPARAARSPRSTCAKSRRITARKRLVEGDRAIAPGMPVVVLEDVITTGGSTLKAVEKLGRPGVKVVGVVALVDAWRAAPKPSRPRACRWSRSPRGATSSPTDRGRATHTGSKDCNSSAKWRGPPVRWPGAEEATLRPDRGIRAARAPRCGARR